MLLINKEKHKIRPGRSVSIANLRAKAFDIKAGRSIPTTIDIQPGLVGSFVSKFGRQDMFVQCRAEIGTSWGLQYFDSVVYRVPIF